MPLLEKTESFVECQGRSMRSTGWMEHSSTHWIWGFSRSKSPVMADISTLEQPFVQPLADAEMTLTSHAQMLLNFMSACEWKLIYYDIQNHVKVITLSFFLWKLAFTVFDTSLEALSQPTSVSRTCCTCLLLSSRFQQTQSLLCFACRCNCQT